MPADLITDSALHAVAKLLYGALQLTPGFYHPTCWTTYSELGKIAHVHAQTAKRGAHELAAAGWLDLNQAHRHAPVQFTLRDPIAETVAAEVAAARRRVAKACFAGEALMREYLSLIVASDQFVDDATPGFLANPSSGERMQLDRYYPSLGVAFEFNGPQHYRATRHYTRKEAIEQRTRDHIKSGICTGQGIRLVVLQAADLKLARISRKVGDHLPRRDLTRLGLLIEAIESMSEEYRRAARRIRVER